LGEFAKAQRIAVVGLIHFNKSGSTDPARILMASAGFHNYARSVLIVTKHPDEPEQRLLGLAKSNLGPLDVPTLAYGFDTVEVGHDPEDGKPITASRIEWLGETDVTVEDALGSIEGDQPAVKEAAEWLTDWLTSQGGYATVRQIMTAGNKVGHS